MTDLGILLLVDDARNGSSAAVIEALQTITAFHENGKVPPVELCAWLNEITVKLENGYKPDLKTEQKQRIISGAFGFTPSQGRPSTKGKRNFKIACEIYRITQVEQVSIEAAMFRLFELYPDHFDTEYETNYLWDIWKEHGEGAKAYYQDWLDTMILNNERPSNTS